MEKQNNTQQMSKPEVEIMTPIIKPTESMAFLMSPIGQQLKKFELTQRMAQVYASSTIVPESYRGAANLGNVIIAMEMAERMNMSPIHVMQNLYIVYGNTGWSSKYLIGSFNTCGRFEAIQYEFFGSPNTDSWGARAYTYSIDDKEHKNKIIGPTVTIGLAKKEGWYDKKGSKWQTIPELMLRYRSAGWLINTTAPEISLGMQTKEELEDTFNTSYDVVDAQPQRRQIVFGNAPANNPVTDAPEPKQEEQATAEPKDEANNKPANDTQKKVEPKKTRDSLFA